MQQYLQLGRVQAAGEQPTGTVFEGVGITEERHAELSAASDLRSFGCCFTPTCLRLSQDEVACSLVAQLEREGLDNIGEVPSLTSVLPQIGDTTRLLQQSLPSPGTTPLHIFASLRPWV